MGLALLVAVRKHLPADNGLLFYSAARAKWCEVVLAVKPHPRKLKGPGVFMLPARVLTEPTSGEGPAFQQRTNTSWRSTRSQPAVSRRLFRCLGAHLLRSPSIVKSGLNVLALLSATNRHTPSVERDRSVSANSVLRPVTSFRRLLFSTHRFDPFVSLFQQLMDKQKTLLPARLAGFGNSLVFDYLLTSGLSNFGS